MASQGWCADRLADWLKKYPKKGPKEAKEKLEEDYGIKLRYSKAWSCMKVALENIHGKYEDCRYPRTGVPPLAVSRQESRSYP